MNRDIKAILQERKKYLAEKFGVMEIAIFGSYARGEQKKDSDVDLIVDLKKAGKLLIIT
jgi:Predicted nucleotidyltransferases